MKRRTLLGGIVTAKLFLAGCMTPGIKDNSIVQLLEPKFLGRKLYEELSRDPDFDISNESYINDNGENFTVVLVLDRHETGQASVDMRKLDILRDKYKINFIGIEGWAGDNVDKKRGRVVLNAQKDLIESLFTNPDYYLIGLEDETLQIAAAELFLIRHLEGILSHFNNLQEILDSTYDDNTRTAIEACINIVFEFDQLQNSDKEISKEDRIDKILSDRSLMFRRGNLTLIKALLRFLSSNTLTFNRRAFNFGLALITPENMRSYEKEFREKYSSFYDDMASNEPNISEIPYISSKRDQFATTKMISEMLKMKRKVGIMFFGGAHMEGIKREIVEQTKGNCNVIIVQI